MSMIISKTCSGCKRELELSSFRKQKGTKDGLQYECKFCTNARAKERYAAKHEEIVAKNTQWQKNNKVKHARASKRHYESPTGRITRKLNQRLDHLVGKNRESFFQFIGLTPSVLLVYLGHTLKGDLKLEDYGDTWNIGFIKPVREKDLEDKKTAKTSLHWKNLTSIPKATEDSQDLELSK